MSRSSEAAGPGVINAHEMYTLTQIKLRLGVSHKAFRELRLKGLNVIRVGKRGYVSGRQAIQFFEGLKTNECKSREFGANVSGTTVARPDHRGTETEVSRNHQ